MTPDAFLSHVHRAAFPEHWLGEVIQHVVVSPQDFRNALRGWDPARFEISSYAAQLRIGLVGVLRERAPGDGEDPSSVRSVNVWLSRAVVPGSVGVAAHRPASLRWGTDSMVIYEFGGTQ